MSAMAAFDPSLTPALAPPPGIVPSFDNPESQAYQAYIAAGVTTPIMVVFVAMRLYCKFFKTESWGIDDWACMGAVACMCVWTGISLSIIGNPLGPHQWNVPLASFDPSFQKRSLLTSVFYCTTAAMVKSSLLLLYFRLFRPSRKARVMIYVGISLVITFYLASSATAIALATPRPGEGGWMSPKANLRNATHNPRLALGQAVFSTLSDFYVLIIPLTIVSGLQLRLRRKLAVGAIFLTGLIACVCSVVSLGYRVYFNESADISWRAIPVYAWSFAELNVGIAVSCMPVLGPLFKGSVNSKWSSFGFHYIRSRFRSGSSKEHLAGETTGQIKVSDKMNPQSQQVYSGGYTHV